MQYLFVKPILYYYTTMWDTPDTMQNSPNNEKLGLENPLTKSMKYFHNSKQKKYHIIVISILIT